MVAMQPATLVTWISKYYWLNKIPAISPESLTEKSGTGKAGLKDVHNGRTSAGRMRVGSDNFKHLVNIMG